MSLTLAISRARAAKFDDAVIDNPIASEAALPRPSGPPKVRDIIAACAKFHGLTVERIVSHRRTGLLIRPRHIAMYLAREMTPHSFPTIGRVFDRDHSSVWNGARRIERSMLTDAKLAADVEMIQTALEGKCSALATR